MAGQKLSLQQKLLQKLSPQQIQMIKLLELPAMQLEQRIKREIEENPVLEIDPQQPNEDGPDDTPIKEVEADGGDISIEEYLSEERSYKYNANNFSKDDQKTDIPFSVGLSFQESLSEQLSLLNLSDEDEQLAEYIVGNIDENGYLCREVESIVDDLAFNANISTSDEKIESLLGVVQTLDPPGIGARSLQECLKLQLDRKDQHREEVKYAKIIIEEYFEEFTKKHYDRLEHRLGLNDDQLRDVIEEIVHLNPKPGNSYSNPQRKENQTIVPDFIMDNLDGELSVYLTRGNLPDLKVSAMYAQMVKENNEKKKEQNKAQNEAATFVRQKMDSAKWFIEAIRQRHQTLLLTMNAILEFQGDYFNEGDEGKLKPMILKDIAEITGLDISTISRVSNSKYIQTHFGMFPLKYFFSESMQDESGEEVSTRKIKKILEETIGNEDKRKPVNDEKLALLLKDQGFPIARRTVAKYREQLGIPVARLRKEL